jgi:hypothetical protein
LPPAARGSFEKPPLDPAKDLHGLSQIFTEGYLLFCFIVNLLNPSVLIRVFPCSSVAKKFKIRIAAPEAMGLILSSIYDTV